MNLRNWVYDRRQKAAYLKAVKNLLAENFIESSAIAAVYHSSRVFHQYLKYLNPNIKLTAFEHGLAEIRNIILLAGLPQRSKHALKMLTGKLLFQFYAYAQNDDARVSLLAEPIRRINRIFTLEPLKSELVADVANVFLGQDIFADRLTVAPGTTAVVMLPSIIRYTQKQSEHWKFYKSFADYFLPKLKSHAPATRRIIFKPRGFDPNFAGVKAHFCERFFEYQVEFFDDFSRTNGPVEYYLGHLKPDSLWGNTSSALFYAKAIDPRIKTFSYHAFVMDYLKKQFNDIFPDYHWILEIFYKKYRVVFAEFLPVEID